MTDFPKTAVALAIKERRFSDAFILTGNEDRHVLLRQLWSAGVIDRESLRSVILLAWDHGPRTHGRDIPSALWVTIFQAAGFVAEPDRPKPTGSIRVFRGAPTRTNGKGMSWTTSLKVATWFRDRWRSRGVPAELYGAMIPADAVLAMDDGRNEAEVVVNPSFLCGEHGPKIVKETAGAH